jgi:DNA-binding IscR family transcriptional regulator
VVRALEGSIDSSDVFMREGSNQNPTRRILRDLWAEIFEHASEVLRTTTVEEVCEKRKKLDPQIMYYI